MWWPASRAERQVHGFADRATPSANTGKAAEAFFAVLLSAQGLLLVLSVSIRVSSQGKQDCPKLSPAVFNEVPFGWYSNSPILLME